MLSPTFTHSHLQQTKNANIPKNADLHAEDDFSYTPAVLAAQAGCKEAFQYIMEHLGNDDIRDVNKNPLFQALKVGDRASSAVKVIVRVLTYKVYEFIFRLFLNFEIQKLCTHTCHT